MLGYYLAQAEEYDRLAAEAVDPENGHVFKLIADTWRRLIAKQLEAEGVLDLDPIHPHGPKRGRPN